MLKRGAILYHIKTSFSSAVSRVPDGETNSWFIIIYVNSLVLSFVDCKNLKYSGLVVDSLVVLFCKDW